MLNGMRRRATYANVMATIAVFGLLAGGGAYAASKIGPNEIKKNAVRAKHIKRNAVRSKEIKNRGIALRHIKVGTRNALRGRRGVSTLGETSFRPVRSATDHESDNAGGRFCNSGFPSFEGEFDALPDGARLTGFEFFTFDASTEDVRGFVWRTTPQASGGPVRTILTAFDSSGSGGYQGDSVTVPGGVAEIDEASTYSVVFQLDDGSTLCSEGDDLRLVGARATWER